MTFYGHRPYVSNLSLYRQLRNPTFKGVVARWKMQESVLAKPYANDGGYTEMEHWLPWLPNWPHFPIEGPMPDGPWINPLPNPWQITCYAYTNDCYVDGETTIITVHTTYPVIGVHVDSIGVSEYKFGQPDKLTLTVKADHTSHVYVIFVLRVPPNDLGLPEGEICQATCVVYPCAGCGQYDNTIVAERQGMDVSATQTLGVTGVWNDCFSWEITTGGGSFGEVAEDGDVVYTAPSTNEDCLQNPLISLLRDGIAIDTLVIAVNADFGNTEAFSYCIANCTTEGLPTCIGYFDCDNWRHSGGTSSVYCNNCPSETTNWYPSYRCSSYSNTCTSLGYTGDFKYKDERSAQQLTDGCCPKLLYI